MAEVGWKKTLLNLLGPRKGRPECQGQTISVDVKAAKNDRSGGGGEGHKPGQVLKSSVKGEADARRSAGR